MTTWTDIEDRVPKTRPLADKAGWEQLLSPMSTTSPGSGAPLFKLGGTCSGEELCKVYISKGHIIAYYCLRGQPVVVYRDPKPV